MEDPERYEMQGKIGEGGLGSVYRAYDRHLKRTVAIKRIETGEDVDPQVAFEQLEKESHALSALSSANIVSVFDIDQDDDGPFVVMEYLEGETIDALIERAPLVEGDFILLAEQALEGLIAAHEAGMIHRDIKPGNLMVTWLPSGRSQLKLLDFGLANFTQDQAAQSLKEGGSLLGSIYFMSPEQFASKPLDGRTDLYSLGCVFYFALTGYYPFNGDTAPQVMAAHIQGNYVPAREIRPDINPRLVAWLEKLMAANADERFSSAQEALRELDGIKRAIRTETAAQTLSAPPPPASPLVTAAAPPEAPPLTIKPPRKGLHPAMIMVVVVLIAGIAALVAVIALKGPREPSPAVERNPATPDRQAAPPADREDEADFESERFFRIFVRRHDKNSDAQLAVEELPLPGNPRRRENMRKRYQAVDRNEDGLLDIGELRNSPERLKEVGLLPESANEREMFQAWDTNSDGLLSLEEYQSGRKKARPKIDANSHRKRFRALDLDASDDLSVEEFLLTHLTR